MNLKAVSGILIRTFWLGILLLAVWADIFIIWGARMYVGHAQWFNVSYHEFELAMYGGMIVFKLAIITCFLLPYLGIKLYEYSTQKKG